jgi:hypothetical protein
MLGDVIVYSFECLAQRAEQVSGQSPEEKAAHQGTLAAKARADLGWSPTHPSFVDELRQGSYGK